MIFIRNHTAFGVDLPRKGHRDGEHSSDLGKSFSIAVSQGPLERP